MSGRPSKRGGFTLIELLIALVVLVAILGLPTTLLSSSSALYRESALRSKLDDKARLLLDDLGDRIGQSSSDRCGPVPLGPTATTPSVLYTPVTGYGGGTQTAWGIDERIVLEYTPADPNDGVDNDGDGRVDECRLVLVTAPGTVNEQRRTLSEDVAEWAEGEIPGNGIDDNGNGWDDERGLAFGFDGERVTVMLTLEGIDAEGDLVLHSTESVVVFRNRGL